MDSQNVTPGHAAAPSMSSVATWKPSAGLKVNGFVCPPVTDSSASLVVSQSDYFYFAADGSA